MGYSMEVADKVVLWAKINQNAKIPTKRSEDAGWDLYAALGEKDYIVIFPGCTEMVPSGLVFAVNPDYYLQIEERGSTGTKGLKTSAGIVDAGYRGEINIVISNVSDVAWVIATSETYTHISKCIYSIINEFMERRKNLSLMNPEDIESYADGAFTIDESYKGFEMYKEYFGDKNIDDFRNIVAYFQEIYSFMPVPDETITEFNLRGYMYIYESTKAIAQGIIHRNEPFIGYEVSIEEIMKYTSERGDGKLGSTGK